jgi:hypothetical protein
MQYAQVLTRLAIGLDARPDLQAGRRDQTDDKTPPALSELAADKLSKVVATCSRDSRLDGKSRVSYKITILCIKTLLECGQFHKVEDICAVATAQKRPLSTYPRSERVTYLYYLGKYYFATSQFFNAVRLLDAAYAECHKAAFKHRRLILIYLITASMLLGRFPSQALWDRPESAGLRARFQPITTSMKLGDLTSFRRLTADHPSNPHRDWFLYFRILEQIRLRAEVIVWRSLTRRIFLLRHPTPAPSSGNINLEGKVVAQTLSIHDVHACAHMLVHRSYQLPAPPPGQRHTNWIFTQDAPLPKIHIHPDFAGAANTPYADHHANRPLLLPSLRFVEAELVGLVQLGLLRGYVAWTSKRFAVQGAGSDGNRDARHPSLRAGWPDVWRLMRENNWYTSTTRSSNSNSDSAGAGAGARFEYAIPGWRRPGDEAGSLDGARVVHMAGAAPAGS